MNDQNTTPQGTPAGAASALNDGLEIEDLYSEDGRHFFAKGWHDKQAFADQLTSWGEPGVTVDAVQHCYGGTRIAQTDEGPANCLRVFQEPGRGRFQMTYWDSLDVDL